MTLSRSFRGPYVGGGRTTGRPLAAWGTVLAGLVLGGCESPLLPTAHEDRTAPVGGGRLVRLEPRSEPYIVCHDDGSLVPYAAYISETDLSAIRTLVVDAIVRGPWRTMMDCLGVAVQVSPDCSHADVVVRWSDTFGVPEFYNRDGVCRIQGSSGLGRVLPAKENEPHRLLLNVRRLPNVAIQEESSRADCESYDVPRFRIGTESDSSEVGALDLVWTVSHEWGHILLGLGDFVGSEQSSIMTPVQTEDRGPRSLGSVDRILAVGAFPELLTVTPPSGSAIAACHGRIAILLQDTCRLDLLDAVSLYLARDDLSMDDGGIACGVIPSGRYGDFLQCQAGQAPEMYSVQLAVEMPPNFHRRRIAQWDIRASADGCIGAQEPDRSAFESPE